MTEKDDAIDPALDPALMEETSVPTDAALASVAALAQRERSAAAEIMDLTEKLLAAQARYRQVTETDLPQALARLNMRDFSLGDGTRVALQTKFDATNLTDPSALAWVAANGGSSLIKTVITVEFDRGDVADAKELYQLIRSHRSANKQKRCDITETVLWQTVAKFARQLIEAGKDPPLQRLGVHRRTYATVGDRPKSVELKGFRRS